MKGLFVPSVTADEVNQAFGNGMAMIANGVWQIVNPFVAAVVVIFVIGLVVRGVLSRKR